MWFNTKPQPRCPIVCPGTPVDSILLYYFSIVVYIINNSQTIGVQIFLKLKGCQYFISKINDLFSIIYSLYNFAWGEKMEIRKIYRDFCVLWQWSCKTKAFKITVLGPYSEQNLTPKMPICSLWGHSKMHKNTLLELLKTPICTKVIVFSSLFVVSNHLKFQKF